MHNLRALGPERPKNQMAAAHERTLAASPGLAANERALAATTGLDAAAFHAGASSALRDAQATLFATEAQLAVTQESLATTKGRIEEAENRIVVNQNQNLALLTQQRRYRVQLMRQTDGLAARTRRLTLSQDTLLETSQKMEVLRMRQCRAAENLRARSNEIGLLADRIAERRQQLHSLKLQALMTRLRTGCGRSTPLQQCEVALAVWRQHVAEQQQARKNLRRAALRFRASTLLAGLVRWQAACAGAAQRSAAARHTHALAELQDVQDVTAQRLQLQAGGQQMVDLPLVLR